MTEFSVLDRVDAARTLYPGDEQAALEYCEKNAIEDAMWLLERSRIAGRYDHTRYPQLPDIFQRQRQGGADSIWEGRQRYVNKAVAPGTAIAQLDVPGAYLNALKCHLPIGKLTRFDDGTFDRQHSGAYFVQPPAWDHPDLPSPLGNRKSPGPLWIMRPTLQLLLDAAAQDLCDAPVILESWTAFSSESLLGKFRGWLVDARTNAIAAGDELAEGAMKKLYSKFVSTMGDSHANYEMRRQDWGHAVRAQAFANLWRRALKASGKGLTVYKAIATDELHVVGDWRAVWDEGRGLGQMSLKGEYVVTG